MKSLFQRGAAMIVLVTMMLAPVSLCHAQSGIAKHACCAQAMHTPASLKPDCCTVQAPSTAAVVVRAVPAPVVALTAHVDQVERPVDARIVVAVAPVFHPSPPPGASVLRI